MCVPVSRMVQVAISQDGCRHFKAFLRTCGLTFCYWIDLAISVSSVTIETMEL